MTICKNYLSLYFWLCWGFMAAVSRASSCRGQAPHCSGLPRCGAWALGWMGSAVAAPGLESPGSVTVAHGLSCSMACGIFLDQGSNPHFLHWPADSLPLSHQESSVYDSWFTFSNIISAVFTFISTWRCSQSSSPVLLSQNAHLLLLRILLFAWVLLSVFL